MTKANALCSDSVRKGSIENLEGCQNAVGFVQSIIPELELYVHEEEDPDYPRGCYFNAFDNAPRIYFNTHSKGHRESYSREVCIIAGM